MDVVEINLILYMYRESSNIIMRGKCSGFLRVRLHCAYASIGVFINNTNLIFLYKISIEMS